VAACQCGVGVGALGNVRGVKSSRHGDHLHKLTRQRWVNCYLVAEDDGFTLVDTMIGGSARDILKAADEAGGDVRRIALTHAHADHVGSLEALHRELPDAEVLISERDARFIRGDKSIDADEPDAKPRGGLPKLDVEPTRRLNDGDRVASLEVVAAPGHTPGQVAFLDTRDRTLIAGDAFQTLGGVAVSGKINAKFPLPAFATWHKPTAIESARRLRGLDPSRLAVGHGRILESPVGAMDRAIADAS
jgi:glyoxylase-like metal-dependent hydrolase (beta-lactamase superfamily II)